MCVAGVTATAAVGTHPGMQPCSLLISTHVSRKMFLNFVLFYAGKLGSENKRHQTSSTCFELFFSFCSIN